MLRTIIIGAILLVLILWFVFGVIGPLFKKSAKVEIDPVDDIDNLVGESERVAVAVKKVRKKASTVKSKIKTVDNNLKTK